MRFVSRLVTLRRPSRPTFDRLLSIKLHALNDYGRPQPSGILSGCIRAAQLTVVRELIGKHSVIHRHVAADRKAQVTVQLMKVTIATLQQIHFRMAQFRVTFSV